MAIIYALTNRQSFKSYVGQSWVTLEERYGGFTFSSASRVHGLIGRSVKKHGWDAFMWHEIEMGICTQSDLDDREQFWIAYLQTLAPNGYNLRSGGGAGRHSLSSRVAMSAAQIRSIEQRTLSGQLIRVFESHNEAVAVTGINNITKCCAGHLPHAGGFIWRYASIDDLERGRWSDAARDRMSERLKQSSPLWRPVQQLDLVDGRVLETYPSVKHAQEMTGATNVSPVCRGLRKSSGGFGWRYALDR